MDNADRAQELEERERRQALAAQQATATETPREVDGVRVCLGCEEEIAPPRLAANPDAVRCMDRQTLFERSGGS